MLKKSILLFARALIIGILLNIGIQQVAAIQDPAENMAHQNSIQETHPSSPANLMDQAIFTNDK